MTVLISASPPSDPQPPGPVAMWIARCGFLLMLVLGIGIMAGNIYEWWLMAELRNRGQQLEADVTFDLLAKEEDRYRYAFELDSRRYAGGASIDDPRFSNAFKRTKSRGGFPGRSHVGTVTVTYLPENPERHQVGVVDDERVSGKLRALWVYIPLGLLFTCVGGLLVLADVLTVIDSWRGRSANSSNAAEQPGGQ